MIAYAIVYQSDPDGEKFEDLVTESMDNPLNLFFTAREAILASRTREWETSVEIRPVKIEFA